MHNIFHFESKQRMESFSQMTQIMIPCFKMILAAPLTLLTTVSAGLFQDTVRYCNLEESTINSLAITSILFILSLIHTIKERMQKRSFNCDFMFSLGLPISFIIGSFYSITKQRNILQQSLFKVIITYLSGKTINTLLKTFNRHNHNSCSICLQQLGKQIIQIKCQHAFHQHCLLQWIQTKNTCPLCVSPL